MALRRLLCLIPVASSVPSTLASSVARGRRHSDVGQLHATRHMRGSAPVVPEPVALAAAAHGEAAEEARLIQERCALVAASRGVRAEGERGDKGEKGKKGKKNGQVTLTQISSSTGDEKEVRDTPQSSMDWGKENMKRIYSIMNGTRDEPTYGGYTDFTASGCRTIPTGSKTIEEKEDYLAMTVSRCFTYCSQKAGSGPIKYFSLNEGKKCLCSDLIPGEKAEAESCDAKCSGDPSERCGGIGYANVYIMIDCTRPTKAEKDAMQTMEVVDVLQSYTSFEGKTCGQGSLNYVRVNGRREWIGTADECKYLCMKESGHDACGAFTYEANSKTCTFHKLPLDGEMIKGDDKTCWYKEIGPAM